MDFLTLTGKAGLSTRRLAVLQPRSANRKDVGNTGCVHTQHLQSHVEERLKLMLALTR